MFDMYGKIHHHAVHSKKCLTDTNKTIYVEQNIQLQQETFYS